MIVGLKPYPTMKDSGLPWVGEIPAHWDLVPNRALLRRKKVLVGEKHQQYALLSLTKSGVIVRDLSEMRGKFSADMGTSQEVRQGDLVFCLFDVPETPRTVGLSRHDGMITGAYTVFQCADGQAARFLEAFYIAMDDRKLLSPLYSGLRHTIPPSVFLGTKTPLPPPSEQSAIVRFLDHADRRIRKYIRAKQKLIKLLEEQKQAIIHRAVTRGLDPNVRLKPSGVEWLGEVPEHWEVVPFKRRVGFQEGPGIMAVDFRDEGVPLLRIACLRGQVATLEGCNFLDPEMVRRRWSHFRVQSGDYLLSASASTGSVVLANDDVAGAIPYTGILRLWSISDRTFMPFVRHYMAARPFQDQIDAAKSGVAIEHFGPTHLKRMWIALPPIREQREIVEFIESEAAPFASATDRAASEIDLLREYRTRLIADVVTGKLDARAAGAQLPDEPEELEAVGEVETEGDAMSREFDESAEATEDVEA